MYELPKNVLHVGEADWLQHKSADVRIPSENGGWEARSYMRLALGRWYLVLVCVVCQSFGQGWWVVVRNACSIGPNRAQGSTVKGMRTMFFWYINFGAVEGSWNVRVALHSSELNAFEMLSPMSWSVYKLGVGEVYELPKNVLHVGEGDRLQRKLADVRIPSGNGGWEACPYMRLALGWWYLVLVCVVCQSFRRGWWVVVRNACSIGLNCAQGSTVKGMRTMFFWYILPMTSSPWMKGVVGVEDLCECPSLPCSWCWRLLSALAVIVLRMSSVLEVLGVGRGLVMLMSAPMVV